MVRKTMRQGGIRLCMVIAVILGMGLATGPVTVSAGEIGANLLYSSLNEEGADNGFGFGLNYTHSFTNNVALEAAVSRTSFDVDVLDGSETATLLPIGFTAQYRFAPVGQIRPWVGGGVAYYITDMTSDTLDEAVALQNETEDCGSTSDCDYSGSVDLKDGVGFHLTAGADFAMSEKIALSLGLQYRILNLDEEENSSCVGADCVDLDFSVGDFSNTDTTELDLGGLDVKLGIKYLF